MDCLAERGMLAVCIREIQKSLKDSSKRLIEAKLGPVQAGRG
jgi:phage terminase large subunit